MKKKIILYVTITIGILLAYILVLRYINTSININDTRYFLGRYEFESLIVKLNSNKKGIVKKEVLSYKYTTFKEDYYIHFRILKPKSDTLFIFGEKNDTQYLIKDFSIQSKNREKFYRAKHQSLKLRVKKITKNKYAINILGTVFSNSYKDSLLIKSDLLLIKD